MAHIGHWKLNPVTGEITGSDELFRIFGLNQDEATLDAFVEVVHPEDREYDLYHIRRGIEFGENWSIEHRLITKDGTEKWINAIGEAIRDQHGEISLLIGTVQDITEHKRAEQLIIEENRKLKELSKMKKDLITRISHELKTPLTSIHGASYYLLNFYTDKISREIFEYLEIIHRGGLRLKGLIDDLIDTSRLEARKLELKKTELNISEIIKDCIKDLSYIASDRNLKMNLDVPERILIECDKIRVGQVITNIISNAIKNTEPYGEISVHLKDDVDYIDVQIKDTGVGITQEEMPLLFKKFGKIERYGQGFDVVTEGSGLGLFISKEIVELHNGDLFFESEGRYKGTTFTIRLPKISK
jgi:PAS domain S-box-containing protein